MFPVGLERCIPQFLNVLLELPNIKFPPPTHTQIQLLKHVTH